MTKQSDRQPSYSRTVRRAPIGGLFSAHTCHKTPKTINIAWVFLQGIRLSQARVDPLLRYLGRLDFVQQAIHTDVPPTSSQLGNQFCFVRR